MLVELNQIFNVEYGNKFDLNKMHPAMAYEDSIAFVGRSGQNNGCTAFVSKLENVAPYEAGLITVALGGAILSSFIQPRPFYTGQNVAVLKPIKEMDLATKAYYCICITENRHRYGAFGREANRTLRTLLVPKRADVPAWVGKTFAKVVKEWTNELKAALKD